MQPDNAPAVKLREMIEQNGQLAYDAERTHQLLMQACPGYQHEVEILAAAQHASLPWELLNLGPEPSPHACEDLVEMLEEKAQLPPDAALWAIQTWAYALDIQIPTLAVEDVEPRETATAGENGGSQATATADTPTPWGQASESGGQAPVQYMVVDGASRWGPANVETLNQWAREGRLHGQMLFEDKVTGRRYSANEVPGLFIPARLSQETVAPYVLAPGQATDYDSQIKSTADAALLKAILTTLFCCVPVGIASIVYAAMAKSSLTSGNVELARSQARTANIWSNWAIGLGLAWWVIWLLIVAGTFTTALTFPPSP